jgi:hypothetical protein
MAVSVPLPGTPRHAVPWPMQWLHAREHLYCDVAGTSFLEKPITDFKTQWGGTLFTLIFGPF